ncbi:MAG: hypothetical protein Q8R48_06460, partial [Candidatus Omnitrophota bacterium]|nr:hypothetical protein [Candidatus Omnitrophota bacterium]
LIMLLGPWDREFVGLLPLLFIFLELRRARRITWIAVISSLFLLHALFPTAIVKCLLFHDLPLGPVFTLGNLGASFKQGTFSNLQWRIFIDIVSIYPPTIFVLLLTSWMLKLKAKKKIFDQNTVFLFIFFLLSFLPFLKLFREQVHLNYSLIPLSVLLAMAAEDLWISAGGLRRFRVAARIALTALIVLIVADHSLNLYAVRKVTLDMHRGTSKLKEWFMDNVPRGTNVITNAHHPDDIRYYSSGYIELWGAPGGIPDMTRWLSPSPADLQKVINLSGPNGVYLLDVEIKDLPGQRNLERKHYYVRNKEAMKADMTTDLGIIYTTRSRYPFLDPLKYLIPAKAMTWPASPDLEFDFYRGMALDGTPFLKEVSASYHLYKVAGNKIVISEPILARENYCSFNIIFFKGRYYAILQSEGAFDITRVEQKRYSISFEGSSVEEVERKIDGYFAIERTKSAGEDPILIEQGYRGFNIIFYKNRFYAILQSDGAFDIKRVENRTYKAVFQGQDPGKVKAAID